MTESSPPYEATESIMEQLSWLKSASLILSQNRPISPTSGLWSDTEQVKSLSHKLAFLVSEDRGRAHSHIFSRLSFFFSCVCSSLGLNPHGLVSHHPCCSLLPSAPTMSPSGPLTQMDTPDTSCPEQVRLPFLTSHLILTSCGFQSSF